MATLFKGKRTRRNFTGDPEEFRLSLVEHLEELRNRIIRSLLILVGFWVLGWIYFMPVYRYMDNMFLDAVRPVIPPGQKIETFLPNVTEFFFLKLRLSFVIGLCLAFPFLVLQLWGFIEPALKPNESKPLRRLAPVSLILFFSGVGFAWLVLPMTLRWFGTFIAEFPGVMALQQAGTMVFFMLKIMTAFGVAFQLPLVVYILGALDLLSADTLLKYWRHAISAIFVLAMIITPTQDPLTMSIMAVPLCGLFMVSVYVVKFTQARKKKRLQAEEDARRMSFISPEIVVPDADEEEEATEEAAT